MGTADVDTQGAVTSGAPVAAPAAGVRLHRVINAVRVPALNIREIEQNFVVGQAVIADLVIADIERSGWAHPIKVPGLIDERNLRILSFQFAHFSQVDVYAGLGVPGDATAP